MAFKKFLVCADNHGHLVNTECMKKFVEFKANWRPDYSICLGDIWDMNGLRKSANDEEKREGISKDFQAGIEFLDIGFDVVTLGNHDARLYEAAEGAPNGILRESCKELVRCVTEEFAARKIQWIPYNVNAYLQLPEGGPKLIHGFLAGQNPAKAHFERFGSCLFGHVHAPSSHIAKHIDQGQAYALGCMADIDSMTYAERYPNRLGWRNGWGFGIINEKTGKWSFWHVNKEDGHYISPMGVL